MAGTSDDFDADQFRDDIRAAMDMGAAVDAGQRVTFKWRTARTFASADAAGRPWDPHAAPSSSTPRTSVQVSCAVEEVGGQMTAGDETSIGTFNRDVLVVILFDEEYETVGDFDEVQIGDSTYVRRKELPVIALFDAGVHRIVVEARDES